MCAYVSPHDTFKLFVTHIENAGNLLVVWGQRDRDAALAIEQTLYRSTRAFLEGKGAVDISEVCAGHLCCAAYDDCFYRARVVSVDAKNRRVTVFFIDYGNIETVSVSAIRSLAGVGGPVADTPQLATSYLLSRLLSNWTPQKLDFVSDQLKYGEFTCLLDGNIARTPPLIQIMYMGSDYAEYLASHGMGSYLPLQQFEGQIRPVYSGATNVPAPNNPNPMWQRMMPPSNMGPAVNDSMMNGTGPVMNNQMPPLGIQSMGVPCLGAPGSVPNHMAAPMCQDRVQTVSPRFPPPGVPQSPPPPPPMMGAPQGATTRQYIRMKLPPQKPSQYKSSVLEPGVQHPVFVSHIEDGPLAFSVQLLESHPQLESLMQEINSRNPEPVSGPLHAGLMCLARFMGDMSLCRALILLINEETRTCKVYYVDYGNSDNVPYTHVFAIPYEFALPKVLSYRFALRGVDSETCTLEEKKIFKDMVQSVEATLVVAEPDGQPNKHQGDLYIDGKNVKLLLKEKLKKKTIVLRYPKVQLPREGSREEVIISFVEETYKFFVQLSSYSDALNNLMESVYNHCTGGTAQPLAPDEKIPGMPCCAMYTDGSWYRAVILNCFGDDVVVMYVDYGNEAKVKFSDLLNITTPLVSELRVQAIPCLLHDGKSFNHKLKEIEGQSFIMHVISQKDAYVSVRLLDSSGNDIMGSSTIPQVTSPQSEGSDDSRLVQQRNFNDGGKGRSWDKPKATSPGVDSGFNEDQNWRKPGRSEYNANNESLKPSRSFGDDDNKGFGDNRRTGVRFGDRGDRRGGFGDDAKGPRGFGDKPRGDRGDGGSRFGDRDDKPRGGFGDRGGRFSEGEDKQRGGFGDRGGRFGDSEDKPRGGFGDRGGRFGDREDKPRGGFGDREDRPRGGFGDKDRPRGGFGDKEDRPRGGFGDKADRPRGGFGDRDDRPRGGFGDRDDRPRGGFGDRDDRPRGGFGDRDDRPRGGFGDRDDRPRGGFGDRDDRPRGGFGDRDDKSRGGFGGKGDGDRPPRGGFGDRDDKPRGGFGDRDRRGGDREDGGRFGSKGGRFGDRSEGGGRFGERNGGIFGEKSSGFSAPAAAEGDSWDSVAAATTSSAAPTFPFTDLEGKSDDVGFVFGDPSKFFVHKRPENPDFTQLAETITCSYSEENPSHGSSDVTEGLLCIAYSEVYQGWYRARVICSIEGGAHLSFIDYGNEEDVYYDNMKKINDDLKTLPPQAIPCTLRGVPAKEWSEDEVGDFATFAEVELRATFVELNDGIFSTVITNTASQETANEKFGATPESLLPVAATYYVPDMTVESGSSAQVEVSWFVNPSKFFIQFLSSRTELTDLLQSIQDNFKNLKPLKTCDVGWFVLARSNDDKVVYRAQVKKADGPNQIGVEFIDFGNCELLEMSSIYSMEPDYVSLPRQAVRSKLDGVAPVGEVWPPAGTSDLDNSFMGEMTCTVNYVVADGVLGVSLNRGGVNVASEIVEKNLAVKEAPAVDGPQEIDMDLLPGQVVSGRVTYVNTEDKRLWVALEKSVADHLQEQIALCTAEPETLIVFEAEAITNGNWGLVLTSSAKYLRAEIIDSTCASGVLVRLGDVGSCEEVTPDKIYYLPETIALIPAQATEFVFDGSAEEGREVMLQIWSSDDGYSATLAEEDMCPLPVLRRSAKVLVPYTNGTSVWVQLASFEQNLAELLDKLFEAHDSMDEDSFTPSEGSLCAAKSVADEAWYRGRIVAMSEEGVTVLYVDYGNTEVVPKENVRQLLPDFKGHAFAREMQLTITSAEDLSAEITELTANLSLDAEFATRDGQWQVELMIDGLKLSKNLIDLGKAMRREDSFFPEEITAFLAHLESLNEIYIHDEREFSSLEALQAELQTLAETLEEGTQDTGIVCLALFEDDQMWYRAEILADGRALFIDYGNADKVNKVKELPEDKLQLKRYALKCSLKAPHDREWTVDDAKRASGLLLEAMTVKVIEDGDPKIVEVVVGGRDLATQLVEAAQEAQVEEAVQEAQVEEAVQEAQVMPESPVEFTAFLSHLESLDEIYVHDENEAANLEALQAEFQTLAETLEGGTQEAGLVCLALFKDDGMWYRAEILADGRAQFIDYGNADNVEQVKLLPEDKVQLKRFAVKCSLKAPEGKQWTPEEAIRATELLCEAVTVKVVEGGDPKVVEMAVGGRDLKTELVQGLTGELPTNDAGGAADTQPPADDYPVPEEANGTDSVPVNEDSADNLQSSDEIAIDAEESGEVPVVEEAETSEADKDEGVLQVGTESPRDDFAQVDDTGLTDNVQEEVLAYYEESHLPEPTHEEQPTKGDSEEAEYVHEEPTQLEHTKDVGFACEDQYIFQDTEDTEPEHVHESTLQEDQSLYEVRVHEVKDSEKEHGQQLAEVHDSQKTYPADEEQPSHVEDSQDSELVFVTQPSQVEDAQDSEPVYETEPVQVEDSERAETAQVEDTLDSESAEFAQVEDTLDSECAEPAQVEDTKDFESAEPAQAEDIQNSVPAEPAQVEDTQDSECAEPAQVMDIQDSEPAEPAQVEDAEDSEPVEPAHEVTQDFEPAQVEDTQDFETPDPVQAEDTEDSDPTDPSQNEDTENSEPAELEQVEDKVSEPAEPVQDEDTQYSVPVEPTDVENTLDSEPAESAHIKDTQDSQRAESPQVEDAQDSDLVGPSQVDDTQDIEPVHNTNPAQVEDFQHTKHQENTIRIPEESDCEQKALTFTKETRVPELTVEDELVKEPTAPKRVDVKRPLEAENVELFNSEEKALFELDKTQLLEEEALSEGSASTGTPNVDLFDETVLPSSLEEMEVSYLEKTEENAETLPRSATPLLRDGAGESSETSRIHASEDIVQESKDVREVPLFQVEKDETSELLKSKATPLLLDHVTEESKLFAESKTSETNPGENLSVAGSTEVAALTKAEERGSTDGGSKIPIESSNCVAGATETKCEDTRLPRFVLATVCNNGVDAQSEFENCEEEETKDHIPIGELLESVKNMPCTSTEDVREELDSTHRDGRTSVDPSLGLLKKVESLLSLTDELLAETSDLVGTTKVAPKVDVDKDE